MTIRKSQSSRCLLARVAAPAALAIAIAVTLVATVACGGCTASGPSAPSATASSPQTSALREGAPRPDEPSAPPAPIVLGPAAERPFSLAPPVPAPDDPRTLRFLQGTLDQMAQLERAIGNGTGAQRFSHGALAAALLARAIGDGDGDPDERQRLTAEARRALTRALDLCSGGGWGRNDCFRAAPVMERVAMSAPEVVGEELRRRLARQLRDPGDGPVGGPWGFGETENQRAVRFATELGYLALHWQLDGGGELGPRRARQLREWSDAAVDFLAARDEQGWYEQDSPGYLATSIEALAHLADFAPDPLVRNLASRQLSVLFAGWAQRQVRGFPAGAKTRTYQHWALGPRNTPWQAWYWWLTGEGSDAGGRQGLNFLDAPILPASGYRVPAAVAELLGAPVGADAEPYELRERRRIDLASRRDVDGAIYTWVTPDYTLSTAQAVDGLALGISGGQEIMATLYAGCTPFAPIYLWSRTRAPRSERWRTWTDSDRAAGAGPVALARLGTGADDALGHAYLDADWETPRPLGDDTVTVRCGDVYAALSAPGGFEVADAQGRFGDFYGQDPSLAGSRVAIPRRAGGPIALEVSSARESGDYEAFRRRIAEASELRLIGENAFAYRSAAGQELVFDPGVSLTVDGLEVEARDYPLVAGPHLTQHEGLWNFVGPDGAYRFPALERADPARSPNP
jgi:hypothetical protein